MTARTRSLLIILCTFLVAGAAALYAYLGVSRREERAAAAKAAAERLVAPVAQPDGGQMLIRYDRLVITTESGVTELGRLPDAGWVIIRPFRARADPRIAEEVVTTLQSLRLNKVVDEQPKDEDLKRYGLQPPRFVVTATAEGAPPLTFSGGVVNSFDGSFYFQRQGDGRVYAVDASDRTALEKTTESLRALDVVGVRDLGLLGVQVKSARHDWAAAREPEKPWAFSKPPGLPADGSAISHWVAGLAQQRATKFLVDTPAERKRTRVEKPDVEANFRRLDEKVRVRLTLGPADSDPGYVLREDSFGTVLAEVPRTALAALDVSSADVRDRRVLIFQPEEVVRIRIVAEGAGPAMVLQREPGDAGASARWLLASRDPQPISPAKVTSILSALGNLRWLPLDETPPKDAGLGATARTVVLEDRAGRVLATLVLGKTVSRKERTIWTRSASGEVVQVDMSALNELPSGPQELLDTAPLQPPPAPPPPKRRGH